MTSMNIYTEPRTWTPDNIDALRRMAARGHSTRAIAAAIGCTRNAVIGKARRLGVRLGYDKPVIETGRPIGHKQWVDWAERRRVFAEVQKAGGTARDAANLLGLKVETVLKAARKLNMRFPHRTDIIPFTKAPSTNAGTMACRARNASRITAYWRGQRFKNAMEAAPEQPLSDDELIQRGIDQGKVTRLEPGVADGFYPQMIRSRASRRTGVA